MPPASIRLPARIKNGMATNGYLSSEAKICWAITNQLMPATYTPNRLARPMETAIGMVSAKQTSMDKIINCDIICLEGGRYKGGAKNGAWPATTAVVQLTDASLHPDYDARSRQGARVFSVLQAACIRHQRHDRYSSVRSSSWDSFLALAQWTMTASRASAIPTGMAA